MSRQFVYNSRGFNFFEAAMLRLRCSHFSAGHGHSVEASLVGGAVHGVVEDLILGVSVRLVCSVGKEVPRGAVVTCTVSVVTGVGIFVPEASHLSVVKTFRCHV